MKILAIRGKNLASLSGSFEVDLNKPPLLNEVFAITGPTGSGKTTLLDTICLALFDRVPRFSHIHSFKMTEGADTLESKDVRNLLRRGAVHGEAEVDFRGQDNRVYRATWRVQRAREKANGRIQQSSMSLFDVAANKEIGDHKKRQTLELIQAKLGLDFNQFCRSVLLAQGDFSAFLKAAPKDRAELLERMTGTEIYSKLSIAAFKQASNAKLELKEIEDRIQNLEVLEAEERRKLDQQHQDLHAGLDQLNQEEAMLKSGLSWYQAMENLEQNWKQALAEIARLEEETRSSAQERQDLVDFEKLQPLIPLLRQVQESESLLARREQEQNKAKADSDRASLELTDLEKMKIQVSEHLERVKTEGEQVREQLEKARALDLRIEQKKQQKSEVETDLARARASLAESEKELRACLEEEGQQTEKFEICGKWLETNKADELLVERWQLLEQDLDQLIDRNHKLAQLGESLPKLTEVLEKKKELHARASADFTTAEEKAAKAEEEAEKLAKFAAAFDQITENDSSQDLETHRQLVQACLEQLQVLTRLETEEQADLVRITSFKNNLKDAELKTQEVIHQRRTSETILLEAEQTLTRVQATLDFDQRRQELLLPHQPCPLCGSQEHPYRQQQQAPGQNLLGQQKERVAQLKKEITALVADQSAAKQEAEHCRQRLAELAETGEERKTALETTRSSWHRAKESLVRLEQSPDTALDDRALQERLEGISVRINQNRQRRRDADQARTLARQADEMARKLRHAKDMAREQMALAERVREAADQALKKSTNEETGILEERNRLIENLVPFCPDQIRLPQQATTLLHDCRHRVTDWKKQVQKRQQIKESLVELEKKYSALEAGLKERSGRTAPLELRLAELEAEFKQLRADRNLFLEGRPVEIVARQLKESISEAESQNEREQKNYNEGLNKQVACEQNLKNSGIRLEEQRQQLSTYRARLEESCQKAGINRADVELGAATDPQRMAQIKTRQNQLTKDLEHWLSLSLDRKSRVEQELETRPPIPQEELKTRLESQAEHMKRKRNELEEVTYKRKTDDERLGQIKDCQPLLEAKREQAQRCQILSDLIGQHDGTKFRKFAQSLTLDALVEEANFHLIELEPRYRLMRVPGQDMELQIEDTYMAGEKRVLETLSGGETFLVSLALALGLSSLSASRSTSIESLFIDEGFGVLDPVTLDSALSSLEALQESGRSIGLISHISAVAERVGVQVKLRRIANGGSKIEICTSTRT